MFATFADTFQVANLVGRFQIERGLTAMFLSSNKTNMDAQSRVLEARDITLSHIVGLSSWNPLHIPSAKRTLSTRDVFLLYVTEYRKRVMAEVITLEENIEFYTEIDMAFLDMVAKTISVPQHDRLLIALDALLRASDDVGIQRALGSSYWSPCQFPPSRPLWFSNLDAQANAYLSQVFRYHEPSKETFTTGLRARDPVEEILYSVAEKMKDPNYVSTCQQLPLQERFDRGGWWFDNVTIYMQNLAEVRVALVNDLLSQLEGTMNAARNEVSLRVLSCCDFSPRKTKQLKHSAFYKNLSRN